MLTMLTMKTELVLAAWAHLQTPRGQPADNLNRGAKLLFAAA